MQERQLAAIMFTDIVGYTALLGTDEDKAFEMLKQNHAFHEKLITKFNGSLIKEIGDGTPASFFKCR
jgi:class 3 adenylate cyclase